jgi:hypothetical protein
MTAFPPPELQPICNRMSGALRSLLWTVFLAPVISSLVTDVSGRPGEGVRPRGARWHQFEYLIRPRGVKRKGEGEGSVEAHGRYIWTELERG